MKATDGAEAGEEEHGTYPEFDLTCSYETPGRDDAVLIHPSAAEPGDEAWIVVDEEFSLAVERVR
jgi:hypothetical protein